MSDDVMMRFRLQQVAAYRELCRHVRRSGRKNVPLAILMLLLAYFTFRPNAVDLFILVYIGLALAELAVGLFKLVYPSAEGVLFDALLLLLFAGYTLTRQGLVMMAGGKPVNWLILLGLFTLWSALGRFRDYRQLRALFANRPTADQLAWFDDLVYEIRTADPETDGQALDLPTRPHWKAKLLGTTAFFVAARGDSVTVAGPDDFDLAPGRPDRRTGHPRVVLQIHDHEYPPFEMDDATRENYRRWVAETFPKRAAANGEPAP